jgi:hypothetical protein
MGTVRNGGEHCPVFIQGSYASRSIMIFLVPGSYLQTDPSVRIPYRKRPP